MTLFKTGIGGAQPTPRGRLPAVHIYTDGSCHPNPGPGGWGAVIDDGKSFREIGGWASETTNNAMELMAVIEGLNSLEAPHAVTVFTDSLYVQRKSGISRIRAGEAPSNVLNGQLWLELEAAMARHRVTMEWIRGHNGVLGNVMADRVADTARLLGIEERAASKRKKRSGEVEVVDL